MKQLVSAILELNEKPLTTPVVEPSSSLTSPETTEIDLAIEEALETEENIAIPPFWEGIENTTKRAILSKWLSFLLISVQW